MHTNIQYLPVNLNIPIRESEVAILLYSRRNANTGRNGIHYVMIRYVDGEFHMFNEVSGDTDYYRYTSIDMWVQFGRNANPARTYTPIALITITG